MALNKQVNLSNTFHTDIIVRLGVLISADAYDNMGEYMWRVCGVALLQGWRDHAPVVHIG